MLLLLVYLSAVLYSIWSCLIFNGPCAPPCRANLTVVAGCPLLTTRSSSITRSTTLCRTTDPRPPASLRLVAGAADMEEEEEVTITHTWDP